MIVEVGWFLYELYLRLRYRDLEALEIRALKARDAFAKGQPRRAYKYLQENTYSTVVARFLFDLIRNYQTERIAEKPLKLLQEYEFYTVKRLEKHPHPGPCRTDARPHGHPHPPRSGPHRPRPGQHPDAHRQPQDRLLGHRDRPADRRQRQVPQGVRIVVKALDHSHPRTHLNLPGSRASHCMEALFTG